MASDDWGGSQTTQLQAVGGLLTHTALDSLQKWRKSIRTATLRRLYAAEEEETKFGRLKYWPRFLLKKTSMLSRMFQTDKLYRQLSSFRRKFRCCIPSECLARVLSRSCTGIFYAASVIGPVVAYIGGGFLLQLFTHFDTIDTSMSVRCPLMCITDYVYEMFIVVLLTIHSLSSSLRKDYASPVAVST